MGLATVPLMGCFVENLNQFYRQAISKTLANVSDGQVNKDSIPEMVMHPLHMQVPVLNAPPGDQTPIFLWGSSCKQRPCRDSKWCCWILNPIQAHRKRSGWEKVPIPSSATESPALEVSTDVCTRALFHVACVYSHRGHLSFYASRRSQW